MALRSRFLRITLIVLGVLAFAGYFAFSTFFFSPTESDYPADISTLAPRDIDFFAAKSRLRADFAEPPRLAVQDELEKTVAWQTWIGSPEYVEFDTEYGVEAQLERVRAELKALPIDPLAAVAARDTALAGYFRGATLESSDWALYARANWIGKLGVSALRYPGLLGLDKQGLIAEETGEVVSLSGGQLARPLHVARIADVVIVGTSHDLVAKALELNARGGQESFGLSARYNDYIQNQRRTATGDDLEFSVDWRVAMEKLGLSGRWPPADSYDFGPRLAARLFQLGAIRSVNGVLGFDSGVVLHAHADLSGEVMTPVQKSLYRIRGRDSAQIQRDLAFITPADAHLCAHLETDLGEFLSEVYQSLDPATRQLLDDTLRSTGQFTGTPALIDELETLFKGRIGLILRDNDYPYNAEKDPPNNGAPTPAATVVLWTENTDKAHRRIQQLQQLVSDNQARFGLRGRTGQRAVFTNTLKGGNEVWEFWAPPIDGTGHVAVSRNGDMYFISNTYAMLADVLRRFNRDEPVRRLSDRPDFAQVVSEARASSNLFAWFDPRSMARLMRRVAEQNALDEVKSRINWDRERAMAEEQALRENFPGKVRGQLDQDTQSRLDAIVGPKLLEIESRLLREQVPAMKAAMERQITYLEACSGALLTVALDPKSIDLSLSAIFPLDK
jgi:hypothetical protein